MILQSHPADTRAWTVTIASGCFLALPATDVARLESAAERLAGPDGFRAVLELLLSGGIASAPSFALLDGDTSVARVVVRGDVTVAVTTHDPNAAELTISGAGVATWSERVLEGASSLHLRVPGSSWTLALEAPRREAADPMRQRNAVEQPTVPPMVVPTGSPAPVPSVSVAESTREPVAHTGALSAPAPSDPEPYDFLFGDTIYRTQAGASVRIPNPDPERPGDHDGSTTLAADLESLRASPATAEKLPSEATPAPIGEATIVAPIPGYRPSAGAVAGAPPAPPRAPSVSPVTLTAVLQLERADGTREPLSSPVLIGRAPTASAGVVASGPQPRLITIADDKDISRSHVRVAIEGDAVVVTDLDSKNGTVVTLPGGSPRKLRGKEPTVVLPDTLIDLGGGVTFTVREG